MPGADKQFFLGRIFDSTQGQTTRQSLYYDPGDLTTHAVVTGMTGSGKTGLCVDLLEEAALQGIPALIIDPKGDLTNLLLHFPDQSPDDFQPWIDSESARRRGLSLDQAAHQAASTWRKGLTEWGIDRPRLQALKNAAHFAVYTPGSDAGLPVSMLSSLEAPDIPWEGNREVLRERIACTVTALLGLVGLNDLDPLRSREHILLSNLFENAWSKGQHLDLTELILQTQTPPLDKLGAFPVETFFPSKDRMALAMQLNNILAAPAFEIWREGQPLDIGALLFHPDGRPRHSVFYLAHLSDAERMFFVTLLLSVVETWMRTQRGVNSLRAIVYMDEIFGYLPPTANPPSKEPLLRMLKQARAFGIGLLLATQNPVDVDYKALSNAGTWFIGKLQTERDKLRLLDGLESARGDLDRRAYDQLISSLGKRIFIQHNIHAGQPVLFQTRWTMNFLAGPLTRAQIPALNQLVGAAAEPVEAQAETPAPEAGTRPEVQPESDVPQPASVMERESVPQAALPTVPGSQTKPAPPNGVAEYFLPLNRSLTEAFQSAGQSAPNGSELAAVFYRPALVASASVRFLDRKYGVDEEVVRSFLIANPDPRGVLRWDEYPARSSAFDRLDNSQAPQARFAMLEAPFDDSKILSALERDFNDWLYRTVTVTARANDSLKVYGGPDVSQAEFMRACADAARESRDDELKKLADKYRHKETTLKNRRSREERELHMDREELSQRKWEEWSTHAENLLGGRSRRRLSTSLTKRRLTEQAKADVEESEDAIEDYEAQIEALEDEFEQAAKDLNDRWGSMVNDITEITVTPKKSDIFVNLFGVAWTPYYLIESGGQMLELLAYGEE